MTPLELLREGRAWLDDPSHWLRGQFLRFSGDDRSIVTGSCASGALYVGFHQRQEVHTTPALTVVHRTFHKIAREMGYDTVPHLNDTGGYAKALELYDRAITELEEQQRLFDRLEDEMAEFMGSGADAVSV